MWVYLLHFHTPICPTRTTQHYLGWALDIDDRIRKHRKGRGSRLCQVAVEQGIKFTVAELWHGNRQLERRLKSLKNARKLCPICNPAGAMAFAMQPTKLLNKINNDDSNARTTRTYYLPSAIHRNDQLLSQ
jgi:predicted GIY-YIG superfamily endonuclease